MKGLQYFRTIYFVINNNYKLAFLFSTRSETQTKTSCVEFRNRVEFK
jgi:hypothetical protein